MVLAFAFSPVARMILQGSDIVSESGRKRADFQSINEASALAVKAMAKLLFSKVTFGSATAFSSEVGAGWREESAPAQPFQHVGRGKSVRGRPDRGLERAQRLAGLAAELA